MTFWLDDREVVIVATELQTEVTFPVYEGEYLPDDTPFSGTILQVEGEVIDDTTTGTALGTVEGENTP